MKDNFNKLTLLCLSFNRQQYLKRSIFYHSQTPINIIYCDGSTSPIDDIEFNNYKNIKYYHLPLTYF